MYLTLKECRSFYCYSCRKNPCS